MKKQASTFSRLFSFGKIKLLNKLDFETIAFNTEKIYYGLVPQNLPLGKKLSECEIP